MKRIMIVAFALAFLSVLAAPAKTAAKPKREAASHQAGQAALTKKLKEVGKKLAAKPGDAALKRAHAELNAAACAWSRSKREKILNEFMKLGGDAAKYAEAELAFDEVGDGKAAQIADFWWSYKPSVAETEDAMKEHAVEFYLFSLQGKELDGLRKVIAQNRIDERFYKRQDEEHTRQTWRDSGTPQEKSERLMKYTRLPYVMFKPPDNIIDALEFFRYASRRYDQRPKVPIKDRGLSFILKTDKSDEPPQGQVVLIDDGAFESDEPQEMPQLPVLPAITACDITLYEAVKLVCESVGHKMHIGSDGCVYIMPKDMEWKDGRK